MSSSSFIHHLTPASARQKIDEDIAQLKIRLNILKSTQTTTIPISHPHPEIIELEARIIALKSTRNSFSAISRLHPDIMQEIFVFTSRSWIPILSGEVIRHGSFTPAKGEIGRASLALGWVCHTWRNLAHQTSALWSYVDFINPTWVEAALSRTREAQLYLDIREPPRDEKVNDRLVSFCCENLHRIGTLRLSNGSVHHNNLQLDRIWDPLWAAPTTKPLLVELTLHSVPLPINLSGDSLIFIPCPPSAHPHDMPI
ncbi:hypothetical protein BDN72DRAFT_682356 [Pluteus cervinus]|uniref:Uncharacterized protein n=1 Tax=Pluteus cervinus TaxID=181527 RepID=A0ACD3ASV5_9AGAR|nr:hypothetical protein BDN72DRAFT_682356 [Pluteus cervinus]